MTMQATPAAQSAIPSKKKGTPLTQALPPPVFALKVHAESNVRVLLITQRPTPTSPKHKINVTDRFMTLFLPAQAFQIVAI